MKYNVWIGTDHPENNYRTWFYFWVEGVAKGTTLTFNVKNMHNQVAPRPLRPDCSTKGSFLSTAARRPRHGGG